MPLELKTGRESNSIEHRSQVGGRECVQLGRCTHADRLNHVALLTQAWLHISYVLYTWVYVCV